MAIKISILLKRRCKRITMGYAILSKIRRQMENTRTSLSMYCLSEHGWEAEITKGKQSAIGRHKKHAGKTVKAMASRGVIGGQN